MQALANSAQHFYYQQKYKLVELQIKLGNQSISAVNCKDGSYFPQTKFPFFITILSVRGAGRTVYNLLCQL